MTFPSYPYATSDFLDLVIKKAPYVNWDIERYDEHDTIGSGHDISSELASPKWTAKLDFSELTVDEEKFLSAMIRKLHGSQEQFMLYDPRAQYPKNDPTGSIIGSNTVSVKAIGSNNQSLRLQGLTAAYQLAVGDKLQISYSSGAKNFFFEVSELLVTADGSGDTAEFEIFPHIPVGIAIDDTVILKKPACKVSVKPKGYKTGRSYGLLTEGISLDVLEQK